MRHCRQEGIRPFLKVPISNKQETTEPSCNSGNFGLAITGNDFHSEDGEALKQDAQRR